MVADRSRTAFQFPGQGSQVVGMGAALADAYPEARTVFQEADGILGFALSTICWEGPEDRLRATEAPCKEGRGDKGCTKAGFQGRFQGHCDTPPG